MGRQTEPLQHLSWTLLLLAIWSPPDFLGGQSAQQIPLLRTQAGEGVATAKDIFVSQLSPEDGLSPGGVMDFFQDADGHLWICTIAGLNRYDGNQVTTYTSDPLDLNSLSSPVINGITQDPAGTIWIATREGGLNAFDPRTERFTHYRHDPDDAATLSGDDLKSIAVDDEGQLWIGAETSPLVRFDPATGTARRFTRRPGVPGELQGLRVHVIKADSRRIYLGTDAGFEYYDRKTGRFRFFPFRDTAGGDTLRYQIYGMARDRQGKVWFGYPGEGLRVYDPDTDTVTDFELRTAAGERSARPMRMLEDQRGYLWIAGYYELWRISPDRSRLEKMYVRDIETHELLSTGMWSIFEDRSGLIWLGSPNRRALYFDPRREVFRFPDLQLVNRSTDADWQPAVSCLRQDRRGAVWFGVDHDLYRYDPRTGAREGYLQPHFIHNLTMGPREKIWLATEGGLYRFDPATGRSVPILTTTTAGRPVAAVLHTAFDRDGDLWVSTWDYGLYRIARDDLYRPDPVTPLDFDWWTNKTDRPDALATYGLQQVMADSRGYSWVCGNIGGVSRIEKATGRVTIFSYRQGQEGAISSNYTYSVVEGPNGYIWISTNGGGINRFDPATERFTHYTMQDGLPSNVVFDLVFDGEGLLWLNTLQGLSSFDPATATFTHYDERDGLQCWTEDLYYAAGTNTLYAAGDKGFNYFSPTELRNLDQTDSPVAIRSIAHLDPKTQTMRQLRPADWAGGRLELTYRESPLRLQFVVLDFRNPDRHRYRYALTQGPEEAPVWIELEQQNQLELARVDPGTYTLQLAGRNSDGRWNLLAQPLTLVVHPPIWRTPAAFLGYLFAFGAGLYFLYRFTLSRQLALNEARQIKTLEQLRSRFYTNITHEFRTPLTVIQGMTETPADFPKAMELIRRNANRLLQLINQLLDLSKLDSNALQPDYRRIEVVSFSRYIGESYQSLADRKHIRLAVHSAIEQLWMDMDEEMYRQVMANLLANALKFTPEHGQIDVSLERTDGQLLLRVRDDGMGIPADALPHVFDRFYQVEGAERRAEPGTGIGLALVRELVSLLGGSIEVTSELGRGATFAVRFPIRQTASRRLEVFKPIASEPAAAAPFAPAPRPDDASSPSLLLIEDNPDVVYYIQSLLQATYRVQVATNGALGIQQAIDTIPDVIISDVMMPEKDGFEVVETLKQDQRTSHIPIILLTARADQEDRLAGLRYGADAYLTKPFDKAELFVRLQQLVALRQQLRARYAQAAQTATALPGSTVESEPTLDDLFLQKVRQVIDEKIGDADLDIAYLCLEVGLSSTQLFRKMKALTGDSPMSFIRQVRLYRAKALLETTELPIAEIAYETGFSDPSYFARVFRKEFGTPPSALRK